MFSNCQPLLLPIPGRLSAPGHGNCLLPGLLEPSCHRCCPGRSPISSGSLSDLTSTTNCSYETGAACWEEEGGKRLGNLRAREGGCQGGMGHWVMTGPWVFWASWGGQQGRWEAVWWKELGSGWESRCPMAVGQGLAERP